MGTYRRARNPQQSAHSGCDDPRPARRHARLRRRPGDRAARFLPLVTVTISSTITTIMFCYVLRLCTTATAATTTINVIATRAYAGGRETERAGQLRWWPDARAYGRFPKGVEFSCS